MFAGRLKLRTFVILAGLGGGALCAGVVGSYLIFMPASKPEPPEPVIAVAEEAPVGAAPSPQPAATPTATAAGPGMRPEDVTALEYRGRDIGSDKLKDVSKGRSFKVNVYQDAGHSTANRVKIDLDRDDKWDEKIDFKPEGVIRQVAPNDDENYTQTYRLVDGAWVQG
ncbi:MAG: hypothetical protein IPO67_23685 [Deltaproteobacteria bacterium]|nr:hypothetical protein [Deltaproteobacteria bacterium]